MTGSGTARAEGGGTQGRRRETRQENPQGPTGTWVQSKGGKGGANGHGIQQQTQAHNAGHRASGGGWRVAGVGDVQVDGVTIRERKWGAGVTDKF